MVAWGNLQLGDSMKENLIGWRFDGFANFNFMLISQYCSYLSSRTFLDFLFFLRLNFLPFLPNQIRERKIIGVLSVSSLGVIPVLRKT
jgi:hypothetical protein